MPGTFLSKPNGTQRQIGTLINISPEVAPDGQTTRMGVNLEYTPREDQGAGAAAKPN